jgi:hypothetical protein
MHHLVVQQVDIDRRKPSAQDVGASRRPKPSVQQVQGWGLSREDQEAHEYLYDSSSSAGSADDTGGSAGPSPKRQKF